MKNFVLRKVDYLKQQWRGVRDAFFAKSFGISVFILALGLLLDIVWQNEIFQRFGAVVVGIAILHGLALQEYAATEMKLSNIAASHKQLFKNSKFNSLKEVMADEVAGPKVKENLLKVTRQQRSEGTIWVGADGSEVVAEDAVVEGVIEMFSSADTKLQDLRRFADRLTRREIIIGVIGTLVWAFGDWGTNLVFHCGALCCTCCA